MLTRVSMAYIILSLCLLKKADFVFLHTMRFNCLQVAADMSGTDFRSVCPSIICFYERKGKLQRRFNHLAKPTKLNSHFSLIIKLAYKWKARIQESFIICIFATKSNNFVYLLVSLVTFA